jgi:hypothetical protein
MALDPEIVEAYVTAHDAYTAAGADGAQHDDPAVAAARENLRAHLAAYILDLEVNGMSVPLELTDEMASLDQG